MRWLMGLLLSLATMVLVLTSASPGSTTTHIGARRPPAEAGCWRTGDFLTDEGKVLGVYRCPSVRVH